MAPQLEGGCDTSGLSIFDRTVDHVLPEVFGGGSEPDNLVKACWPCNHCKFDFTQPLVDPADGSWCGLTDRCRALWGAPTSPKSSGERGVLLLGASSLTTRQATNHR
jgi:hypothetical protein